MDAGGDRPPVVVVTGPTASGKTGLALELAERFAAEVVNADSMQVYRHMDIGTAKPSLEERARAPHHLYDVVDPDAVYSAGRYAEEGRRACAGIHARGHPVLLTGGTGLYIRALLDGLGAGPAASPELREGLEAEHARALREDDPTRLHRRLAERDPGAAESIHPNDLRRIVRALEIAELTGVPASAQRREPRPAERPYRVLHLALDPGREALSRRIDRRCREMIEGGLLQEVRRLFDLGFGPGLRPLQAIGYRHVVPVAQGRDTLERALAAMQRDTRRFARRQRTWLRGIPEVEWVSPRDPQEIAARVEKFLFQ